MDELQTYQRERTRPSGEKKRKEAQWPTGLSGAGDCCTACRMRRAAGWRILDGQDESQRATGAEGGL